ncbi:MAG: hypothetical protein GX974_02030 [Clostridiales bacterium]|nr:hypothetical protein [Clostridiales bacterium]
MRVYALVGQSGTGKSYKAISLANRLGIKFIIDDGLLIKGGKILAGSSAKREPTMIAAAKRAIFMAEDHAKEVRDAIETFRPESILILGTSDGMIEKIVDALGLPRPYEITRIEDIASKAEIEIAREQRVEQGKHIIPVPTLEIRKDFSGYFLDPLKIFRMYGKEKVAETLEKTVMRPTFSYMGRFYISDAAIESIVLYRAKDDIFRIFNIDVISRENGIVIYFDAIIEPREAMHIILKDIQRDIIEEIFWITGLNVLQINITVRGLKL